MAWAVWDTKKHKELPLCTIKGMAAVMFQAIAFTAHYIVGTQEILADHEQMQNKRVLG